MCERPLAHDRASPIEQAGLVLRRAPVDAGEPAYCLLSHRLLSHRLLSHCLVSHGPVLSCPTSHHDACRNLYGRSRARLPTGHPSWPVCRGTDPRLVLMARVHGWSLPTGRLARSAYTGTDRTLPDTGARIRGAVALTPAPSGSGEAEVARALSSSMRLRTWTATSTSAARRSSVG